MGNFLILYDIIFLGDYMKLENLNGKPLDYIEDESGEKRSLYDDTSSSVGPDINSFDSLDRLEKAKANLERSKEKLEEKKAELNSEFGVEDNSTPASDINDLFKDRADDMVRRVDSLFGDLPKHHL